MAASPQGSSQGNPQAQLTLQPEIVLTATQDASPPVSGGRQDCLLAFPQQQINIQDLRAVAADIKDTLSAAIAELRLDIHALNDRVLTTERVLEDHDLVLQRSTQKINAHTLQLHEVNRHLEDLETRSRCHNIRVRGMPEEIEGEQMPQAVVGFFNSVLGRAPSTAIALEWIHRALCPHGRDTDPPRDIICCLVDFVLKE